MKKFHLNLYYISSDYISGFKFNPLEHRNYKNKYHNMYQSINNVTYHVIALILVINCIMVVINEYKFTLPFIIL